MKKYLLAVMAVLMCTAPVRSRGGDPPLAPCDAGFSATVDPVDPMTIHFQDQSSGQIVLWQWSFGDGATSEDRNPVHTYASGGTYFVCLTVSDADTISACHDVMCIAITIHEPGACIADYTYLVDPANPLKVSFSDKSGGNIDSWHWDFGDGSTSDERNPVHFFPAIGKYRVCLDAYNADSVSECNDVKCDSLEIIPPPACHAAFIGRLDTLSHESNTFIFNNMSTGEPNRFLWRFDDGATYHTPDVVHRFLQPGIHQVCLVASRELHGEIICSDSICKYFETAMYYNLGGHLFAGELPINNPVSSGDTGVAYIFRIDGRGLLPFDTCRFTELGYFAFPQLLNGEYLVRAMLTQGSSRYSGYFPGYSQSSLTWQDADTVRLTDSSNYVSDIILMPTADLPQGEGSITGRVLEINPGIVSEEVLDAEVILYDGQFRPVRFTFSGMDGKYLFQGLPYGAYYLSVEYPGRYSRLTAAWLDLLTPVADSLDLELFDHDVTGIPGTLAGDGFNVSVYPNPASDKVRVAVGLWKPATLVIEMRSLAGNIVNECAYAFMAGQSEVGLSIPAVPPGFYVLVIRSEDGSLRAVKKLLIH